MHQMDDGQERFGRQTLGFACSWGKDRRRTWSGTPFRLREALSSTGPLLDVGVELPVPVQTALKLAAARRFDNRWVSMWRHGRVFRELTERRMRSASEVKSCAAVVTIQDLGSLPVPYLVLQDLSYDVLLEHYAAGEVPHFPTLGLRSLMQLRDRQLRVYERASALLPMSHWLAGRLIAAGVDDKKIFPVHPGLNVPVESAEPVPERRQGEVVKLLFVGRDPHTKALDVVVAALARLRENFGPSVALTVAGPVQWPGGGAPPAGVEFLGPVGHHRVAELMNTHDLFVMPSRLEGFGIAFVEALARGLPCVGRRAFAMPEIIRPGVGGALVEGDDPEELAAVVASVLSDDDLYRRCAADAGRVRRHFSWERAAVDVRDVVGRVA